MGHSCDDAIRELYRFLDGALTIERRTVITAHIEECSHCLEVFDFEAELRQVIAMRCREEVPEALRRRILEVIEGGTVDTDE